MGVRGRDGGVPKNAAWLKTSSMTVGDAAAALEIDMTSGEESPNSYLCPVCSQALSGKTRVVMDSVYQTAYWLEEVELVRVAASLQYVLLRGDECDCRCCRRPWQRGPLVDGARSSLCHGVLSAEPPYFHHGHEQDLAQPQHPVQACSRSELTSEIAVSLRGAVSSALEAARANDADG